MTIYFNGDMMKVIDYSQIEENIKTIKKTNDIILVVKNNAYGFGIKRIVEIALKNDIRMFAVNTIAEAIELRRLTDRDILLFGYCVEYIDEIIKYQIIPTANSLDEIAIFNKNKIYYALEIDIGMNRFGIKEYNESIFNNQYLHHVYAHFYNENINYSKIINKIKKLCNKYNKKCHFGGSMLYSKTNESLRLGKLAYSDALRLYGNVVMIKRLAKGEAVGYDSLYKAENDDEIIAVVDIGYYNGLRVYYDGYTYINNNRYKVVGKICMNHSFIKIDDKVSIGDMVEFLGKNISIYEFLSHNNMTEYECFLSIK